MKMVIIDIDIDKGNWELSILHLVPKGEVHAERNRAIGQLGALRSELSLVGTALLYDSQSSD